METKPLARRPPERCGKCGSPDMRRYATNPAVVVCSMCGNERPVDLAERRTQEAGAAAVALLKRLLAARVFDRAGTAIRQEVLDIVLPTMDLGERDAFERANRPPAVPVPAYLRAPKPPVDDDPTEPASWQGGDRG